MCYPSQEMEAAFEPWLRGWRPNSPCKTLRVNRRSGSGSRFHNRPFLVLGAGRFAGALADTVTDPELSSLPLTGAIDQWADNVDF